MTIETIFLGESYTEATHLASKSTINTDAPVDNKGKGSAFSPTDLLAASLGSCMLTIMGFYAEEHQLNIVNTKLSILKIMTANPRRVSEIQITFDLPKNNFSEKDKISLERVAKNCPVAKSLHPDLVQTLVFNW